MTETSPHALALMLVLAAAFFGGLLLQRFAWPRWPSVAGVLIGAGQGGVYGFVATERDFAALGPWAPELRFGWYVLAVALFATLGAVVGVLAIGSVKRAITAVERREIDVLPWTLRDASVWAAGAAVIASVRALPIATGALAVAAVVAFVAMLVARRRRDRIIEAIAAGEIDGWRYDDAAGVLLADAGGADPYRGGPVWTIAARASRRSSLHLR